ncbi:dolichyl-phosphate-mannose--protein mannosyltransferase [Kitasatospora sp. GAS204B]|uniref:dolichyl-phosphate-mannose--protein mannosyltransferase n=1 Tax=unclassified Kitasatospora TaxID=2633591 RepID=UPI00247644DE|nr:phospholipid carrier-dependent glycosyltransferase [Kitasatospora sp. GAS204B]MDH6117964.1 dolichyl-phosphate-mannose-protein mannosyltransferase [Kitasatospora sp. GAS204B]
MNGETAAETAVVETIADTPGGTDLGGEAGGLDPAGIPAPRAGDGWLRRLAALGYQAPSQVPVAERLVPPMPDGPGVTPAVVAPSPLLLRAGIRLPAGLWTWLCRWSGWLGPLAVALFGGLLRFWNLGSPGAIIFDETYYAKDAYALWRGGYETSWPDSANTQIVQPHQVIPYQADPAFVVHPPVGKWIIGMGEQLFGMHPFGWRFMVAVLGTLSILMIARIARRLFRSTLLGCVAGLLLSVDGLHFVMSRTSLLDLVVMFWILAAFGFLLLDRDHTRARIARRLTELPDGALADAALAHRMRLGLRPYRLAAGVCVGLSCSTKWSGMYVAAFFGLLTVFWDLGARKLAGARRPYWSTLIRDGLPAFASIVLVSLVVYVGSWSGWLASSSAPGKGGYGRDWAVGRHGLSSEFVSLPLLGKVKMPFQVDMTWVPGSLRALWHYHSQMYNFNIGLSTPHLYQSNPWSWLVLGRPVSFYYESPHLGQSGCKATECASEVLAIGTPVLWWAGVVALVYCLYRWVLRRDWRAGAVLCGLGAGYLPWFEYQHRTIFLFYAVAFVPFLVLAVTMMIGAMIGPATAVYERRLAGGAGAGLLVLAVLWNFLYFYPLYTGQVIPMDDWRSRMWFTSWI